MGSSLGSMGNSSRSWLGLKAGLEVGVGTWLGAGLGVGAGLEVGAGLGLWAGLESRCLECKARGLHTLETKMCCGLLLGKRAGSSE